MAELSEAKRKLLEQRLGSRAASPRRPDPIPARPPGPAPLSAGQRALVYEHRLRDDEAIYNIVFAYRLSGELDRERLVAAFELVVQRHETLHLPFDTDRQPLTPSQALSISHVAPQQADFDAIAKAEAVRRFDLETGPLARLTLVDLADGVTGLVLALHHVTSDAASLSNLWREIDLAYRGEPLPPISTTYSDHAVWQEQRVTADDRIYWADHLGDEPTPPELGLEVPAAPEPDGYLTIPLDIDPSALGNSTRPTSFFLGAFAALLQRYTNTDEVMVATAASTRDHGSVEGLIGYFLNVLPLRLPVDPTQSPNDTAQTIEGIVAGGLGHRHVPFATIASAVGAGGDLANVMFIYDEAVAVDIGGIPADGGIVHPDVSVTDLTLFVRPTPRGHSVSVEWRGSRYRRHDIERLAAEFVAMTAWAAQEPSTAWVQCPATDDMVGPAIRTELEPIPHRLARHAAESPDAPALRCGDDRRTHRELHDSARSIARGLARHGVTRGERVAVVLRRSTDLVAAVLGIQLLGAAYVPIDPTYPRERIDQLLTDAGASVTIAEASSSATVTVDQLADATDTTELPAIGLDDPAYVIFTSGSTGRPRGVLVDQRRLAASTLGRLDAYERSPRSFLLPSSLGFDSSIVGLFWTLAVGGEIVLPTDEEVHDVDALADLIATANVTHTLMVPSLYRAILQRAPEKLASLEQAIVAGEACPGALVEQHHAALPGVALANEYGPTETTVWATWHQCQPGEVPVPIGRPAPGVRLRVVDKWLRPRPPGTTGELAIGGLGVNDGYLDPSGGDGFVTDPFQNQPLYLSGDAVRIGDNGALLFLGRLDHQVSIGGTRIEPEEIEAAMLATPGVSAAIVRVEHELLREPFDALDEMTEGDAALLLRTASEAERPSDALLTGLVERGASRPLLVAYLEGDRIDTEAVKSAVGQQLPAAMVPDRFEVVERLARTPHGKVDRNALPVPVRRPRPIAEPSSDTGLVASLTDAYRRVLGFPEATSATDFFEAGGDSLRAVEMVITLEEELGRRIPISALVAGRTPAALAALLGSPVVETTAADGVRTSHLVPLRPEGSGPPLILMPPGGGNLVAFDPFVQALEPGMPIIGFDLPGADRDEELPVSVEALCDTYMPQLRAALPHGPYRFLGWSFGGVVALELAQRLTAEGETVDFIGMVDTYVPGYQRAGRLRVYQDLIDDRDLAGIASTIAARLRNRATKKILATRKSLDANYALDPKQRDRWLTMKIDAFVELYDAKPYAGPVLFFAARDTPVWRSVEPWRERLTNLTVIDLDGTHDGEEGLLSGPRAKQMAVEIAERLR